MTKPCQCITHLLIQPGSGVLVVQVLDVCFDKRVGIVASGRCFCQKWVRGRLNAVLPSPESVVFVFINVFTIVFRRVGCKSAQMCK